MNYSEGLYDLTRTVSSHQGAIKRETKITYLVDCERK